MFIDLHSHSVSSDDSRATVEQFVKWVGVLRKKGFTIDGFVLTEHRKFDMDKDYSSLAKQYSVNIFKGSELDTAHGHFLVYGVTEGLTKSIDFGNVKMDSHELMEAAEFHGLQICNMTSGLNIFGIYFLQNIEFINYAIQFFT